MQIRDQKGFTLIELLVVVAIIGLLASIILASLNGARQKGRDARRLADIKELQTSLELYFSDHNAYPIASTATCVTSGLSSLAPTYIQSVSDDPLETSSNCATGKHYAYITDSGGSKYCMAALLEGTPPAGSLSSCGNGLTLSGYNYVVYP